MAFCRITGRSRGLPKPNYFPLLPPISPSAAKRYCRITGKSYGLPSHNFIPVILTANLSAKIQCKITSHGSEAAPLNGFDGAEYGQRKHVLLPSYRYLFPKWDEDNDTQKELLDLLENTEIDDQMRLNNYVYRVDEKSCSLVFPPQLESAIRGGGVRDVMLAKDSDKILLKMRKGTNVSVDMYDWRSSSSDENEDAAKWATLFDGEGPRPEIILERQREDKQKKRRQKKMRHMAKVFEGEHSAIESHNNQNGQTVNQKRPLKSNHVSSLIDSWQSATEKLLNKIQGSRGSCRDLVKPLIESWDWKTYEQMANTKFTSKVAVDLPRPIHIEPFDGRMDSSSVKVPHPELLENTIGFDAIPHVAPLNLKAADNSDIVSEQVIASIRQLSEEQLASTENVIERLEGDGIEQLPRVEDLPEILQKMRSGKFGHLGGVSGLKLDINKATEAHSTFIAGQNINTPLGELFVPGQTVATPAGPIYMPGLTVNTPGVGVSFIPGFVTNIDKENGEEVGFVAGQIIDDKFVAGQTLGSPTQPRFCEGQTIFTEGEFKFVAGIVDDEKFICGQTLASDDGDKFIPGQTITTENGELFFAGMSVNTEGEDNYEFVEGQTITTLEGVKEFVPGKTVKTDEGSKFVPGQTKDGNFIPGVQKTNGTGESEFIPGLNIDTEKGPQFIQGMVTESEFGPIFMPGLMEKSSSGVYEFAVAKNMNEVVTHDYSIHGLVIDCNTCEVASSSLLNVFGYMIQTENGGIEFYPEKVPEDQRLAGKAIPGRLFKQKNTTKFIPGIMSDDKLSFIAGQVVGNEFVPGQVVETEDGLKFVPGQIIETKNGSKFVPGQTFGSRFVPGQIVETRVGPTFIPGQVIFIDGCERFVPGQIVEINDEPRFVPGRVVEEGDNVVFIPGQIVETAEGPRFVAPDLLNNEEGEQEFSVQSFLVSPEELKLIKPNGYGGYENGDCLSMDVNLLRQLSEAGMSVGRQIEMSAVDLVLQSTRDDQSVKNIENAFKETPKEVVKSTIEMIKSVIGCLNGQTELNQLPNSTQKTKYQKKIINPETQKQVEDILKRVYNATSGTKKSMYEILEDELINSSLTIEDISMILLDNPVHLVNKLHEEIAVEENLHELLALCKKTEGELTGCGEYVMTVLKKAVNDETIIECVEAVVNKTHCVDDLVQEVMRKIKQNCGENIGKHSKLTIYKVNEFLIGLVQETINRRITSLCLDQNNKSEDIKLILLDTIQLGKALEVAPGIIFQITELRETEKVEDILQQIQNNPQILELISRTILIHDLVENSPSRKDDESENLINDLRSSPYSIRSNQKFLEVFRKSGVLLSEVFSENQPLKSSHELPNRVLFNDNPLVIEDYLIKRKTKARDALVIIKDTFKAVVPRHLSHAVLTGKCSYTLLDEHGIRHFEPLNVLEALNMVVLRKMPTIKKRFSTYQQCRMETDAPSAAKNMNDHRKEICRSTSEESRYRIAESEEIDGILAMASTCKSVVGGGGGRTRFDSSLMLSRAASSSSVGVIHTALLPKMITSYRYL